MAGNKRLFLLCFVMLFVCYLLLFSGRSPVLAAEVEDRKDCSITLLLGEGEGHLQNPLRGGTVGLYLVAPVHFGEEIYYDASRGQFASLEILPDLKHLSKKELDAKNSALAKALFAEAKTLDLQPMKSANVQDGKVFFDDLATGLYLLTQTAPSEGGRQMNSFLLSIPDGEGSYEIIAAPKPGITTPAVTPTLTPTPPPFIPQTGQLWWPVPILAIAGMVLLTLGFALRRK